MAFGNGLCVPLLEARLIFLVSSRVTRVRDVRDVRGRFSDLGRSSCHGFYALLRNGLWDDPAEAVTDAVYDDFVKAVGSHDLPPANCNLPDVAVLLFEMLRSDWNCVGDCVI